MLTANRGGLRTSKQPIDSVAKDTTILLQDTTKNNLPVLHAFYFCSRGGIILNEAPGSLGCPFFRPGNDPFEPWKKKLFYSLRRMNSLPS